MAYTLQPDAPNLPMRKPTWLSSRTCTLPEAQGLNRAQGALLGLAIGDAVGTTLEFLPRDRAQVSDMVGNASSHHIKASQLILHSQLTHVASES